MSNAKNEPVANARLNSLSRRTAQFTQRLESGYTCPNMAEAQTRVQSWLTVLEDAHLPATFREAQQQLADHHNAGCNHLAEAFGPKAIKRLELARKALVRVQDEIKKTPVPVAVIEPALKFAADEVAGLLGDIHRRLVDSCRIANERADVATIDDTLILDPKPLDALQRVQGLAGSLGHDGKEMLAFLKAAGKEPSK